MKRLKYFTFAVLIAVGIDLTAQNNQTNEVYQGIDNHTYTPLPSKKDETQPKAEAQPKAVDTTLQSKNSAPQFLGGDAAMQEFIRLNLNTSISEQEMEGGQVSLSFTVNTNGMISNIKILTSLDYACDKEAVRLVRSMPQWTPGMENGQFVTMDYNLSIAFNSQNNKSKDGDIYIPAGRINSPTQAPVNSKTGTTSVDVMYANVDANPLMASGNRANEAPQTNIDDLANRAPQFQGGEDNMWRFIEDNIDQRLADESGTVTVSFVVQPDGSISDLLIVKGLGFVYDREALRIVKAMPTWIPAVRNGSRVAYEYKLVIPF